MESIDPATGKPLPGDAIQRILFIAMAVHVYNIPPQTSAKGHTAATWTVDAQRHIFTARLRLVETAFALPGAEEKVKVDVVLEDGSTGQLFAAAPYTSADVVESALDSSRFFALRVQDGAGRKAMLGIGFEERPEAFDFSVALQEARKTLGLDQAVGGAGKPSPADKTPPVDEKRDYSLKEGETITVNFGSSKFRRSRPQGSSTDGSDTAAESAGSLSSFSLPPPPSSGSRGFSLPPPPSGSTSRASPLIPPPPSASSTPRPRESASGGSSRPQRKSAAELGFDDGQNGEFA